MTCIRHRIYALLVALSAGMFGGATASAAGLSARIVDAATGVALGRIVLPRLRGNTPHGIVFELGPFTRSDVTAIEWVLDSSAVEIWLNVWAATGDRSCSNPSDAPCAQTTLRLLTRTFYATERTCLAPSTGHVAACNTVRSPPTHIRYVRE